MKKERMLEVTLLGWFFIGLACATWTLFPYALSLYHMFFLDGLVGKPTSIGDLWGVILALGISTVLFFVIGMGVLKRRRWAYYGVLIIPFVSLTKIIGFFWLLGHQFVNRPATYVVLLVWVIVVMLLLRRDIIEQFDAEGLTKKGRKVVPKKFVLGALVVVAVVNIIPALLWVIFVSRVYKPVVDLQPQKIELKLEDKDLIDRSVRRVIFDYSLLIPQELRIAKVHTEHIAEGNWSVIFVDEGLKPKNVIILENLGMGGMLLPISRVLNFSSVYDFESAVWHARFSPLYLVLKSLMVPRYCKSFDDVTTFHWKGFLSAYESEKKSFIYSGNVYDLKSEKTGAIAVRSQDGMTLAQERSILASVEFNAVKENADSFFKNGRQHLSDGDLVSAQIDLINALYRDQKNPEYAYYLARALYEDQSPAGRQGRLSSAKRFLMDTLQLNPDHQAAKEILIPLLTQSLKDAGAPPNAP
jgi:hypothetical protein